MNYFVFLSLLLSDVSEHEFKANSLKCEMLWNMTGVAKLESASKSHVI